jgi:hypothetical protein
VPVTRLAVATLLAVTTASAAAPVYDVYCNARYGYCVAYPRTHLLPQGESDNGDGQVFLSRDGKAKLTVWGEHLVVSGDSLAARYAQRSRSRAASKGIPARTVTYRLSRPDWFVVSGKQGTTIFYEKVIYKAGRSVLASFTLTYPQETAGTYDPVAAKVAASFRP